MSNDIVEFDLDEQNLTVTKGPPITNDIILYENRQIIRAEGGVVGFSILSYPHFQMWQRNINGHGVATWVSWKTIDMHTILTLPSQIEEQQAKLVGYDEDTDDVFIHVNDSVYMVQLKSMQSKILHGRLNYIFHYFPFRSFYTPGDYSSLFLIL
jgi:hypothetical protein